MKEKVIYKIIYFNSILLIVLSTIYIVKFFSIKKEAIEERNLLNEIKINENIQLTKVENEQQAKENERIKQVKTLKSENSDIIGWIEIENTKINYPVLQTTDDEYYLTHNYKKEKTEKGSIFLSKDYNWDRPSDNLQIYGHNLGNGEMFQELLKYTDEKFYKEHPNIRFTTANEDSIFEIIAVFKSKVYYKSDKDVFRYYYFINAETEKEYNDFIENAKKASLYKINATAKYKEQLMTLSTCSYHTEDGRFVVVARKK